MIKIKSGVILIAVGVAMNLVGRVVASDTDAKTSSSVMVAGILALWMIASVVVCLFGLFRLIAGLVSKKRQPAPTQVQDQEGIWPPTPKPPDTH